MSETFTYEYETYRCTKETLKKTIDKYGVAIIPDVLDTHECAEVVEGMWKYLGDITKKWKTPITSDNSNSSWKGFFELFPKHSMLLQHWGVGHSQTTWNVRQNRKIVSIFSELWKCNDEDLLVSFDGLSIHLAPEITNRGWFRGNTWYHTDQSYRRSEFECIQSWITANDIEKGDATLSFFEGSNKYHKEFFEEFKDKYPKIDSPKDWQQLNKEQEQFYYDKGCKRMNIKCPKGSLVLWDSRTIHCGIECMKKRKNIRNRYVIYLCYMPRQQSKESQISKKRNAFKNLRTTSHWPCKATLFSKTPNTYGKKLPELTPIEAPTLSELGMKLAGF